MRGKKQRNVRVLTWNVAGLRAALRKGAIGQLERLDADIVLLQEVRAFVEQIDPEQLAALETLYPHIAWNPADKKGYSGTATLSRTPASQVRFGIDERTTSKQDDEGRMIVSRFELSETKLRLINLYMPSGSSGEHRQAVKDVWLDQIMPTLERVGRSPIATVLMGDLNVAHDERDIFYAKSNEKSSGYLPHERAWFGRVTSPRRDGGAGLVDTLRDRAGDVHGPYTWWSTRGSAMAEDRGWRIDHALANRAANERIRSVRVDREAALACSDHAPLVLEIAV